MSEPLVTGNAATATKEPVVGTVRVIIPYKDPNTGRRGDPVWLFNPGDLERVQEGDILVTTMTSPDCLPAMIRAAAFITDEGAISCHAAVVARDLTRQGQSKLCIVSCQGAGGKATKVLKDGMQVRAEIDIAARKGNVYAV